MSWKLFLRMLLTVDEPARSRRWCRGCGDRISMRDPFGMSERVCCNCRVVS